MKKAIQFLLMIFLTSHDCAYGIRRGRPRALSSRILRTRPASLSEHSKLHEPLSVAVYDTVSTDSHKMNFAKELHKKMDSKLMAAPRKSHVSMFQPSQTLLQRQAPYVEHMKENKDVKALKKTYGVFLEWLKLNANQNFKKMLKNYFKIKSHPFLEEVEHILQYPHEVSDLHQKCEMYQQILQVGMKHPKRLLSLMSFYMTLQKTQNIVKNNLQKFSQEFQDFFEREAAEYQQTRGGQFEEIDSILKLKLLLIRFFPYVVTSIKIAVQICLMILISRKIVSAAINDIKQSDFINITDEDFLEAYYIICAGLGLPKIPIYQSKGNGFLEEKHAKAGYLGIGSEEMIVVGNDFFYQPTDVQIFIILHELRHAMQDRSFLWKPNEEMIDFAKNLGIDIKKHQLNFDSLVQFLLKGQLYSREFLEFDADTFALSHMIDFSDLSELKGSIWFLDSNLTSDGYITDKFIHKYKLHKLQSKDHKLIYLPNILNNPALINDVAMINLILPLNNLYSSLKNLFLSKREVYLKYIPEQIKQQAEINRAKAESKLSVLKNNDLELFYA